MAEIERGKEKGKARKPGERRMEIKGIQDKGQEENENKEKEFGKKTEMAIKDNSVYGAEKVKLIFIWRRFLQGGSFTVSPSTAALPY